MLFLLPLYFGVVEEWGIGFTLKGGHHTWKVLHKTQEKERIARVVSENHAIARVFRVVLMEVLIFVVSVIVV